MTNFKIGISVAALTTTAIMLTASPGFAQQSSENVTAPQDNVVENDGVVDEGIVSYGTIILDQHDGMDAFFRGDFATAEIEFEREFKGLKRFESARENAVQDAAIAADRSLMQASAGDNSGAQAGAGGRGGGAQISSSDGASANNAALISNFSNRRGEGNTVLTDGKVTYHDFAFSRYMAGLSEIKLGKFEEARTSLKQSLRYDDNNYDARMRIGLLDVMDADFESAAKHLKILDKNRKRCARLSCDELQELTEATLTLAKQMTKSAASG